MRGTVTNVTSSDIAHYAQQLPDTQVDGLPEIQRLKKEIVLAEARVAAAARNAQGAESRKRDLAEAVRVAERELFELETGQPGLAVDALLGDADAKKRFAEREKRAEELRALLRCHKLFPIVWGRNDEAGAAAILVKNAAAAVTRLEEGLAGQRREAKLKIAKEKLIPR